MLKKTIKYLAERPGSSCIIIFMLLLINCVFLLFFKMQGLAEKTAIFAYFFLVIGMILKLYEWKSIKRG